MYTTNPSIRELSIRELCDKRGVSTKLVAYWVSRLRQLTDVELTLVSLALHTGHFPTDTDRYYHKLYDDFTPPHDSDKDCVELALLYLRRIDWHNRDRLISGLARAANCLPRK